MFNLPGTENNAEHLIHLLRSISHLVTIDYIKFRLYKGESLFQLKSTQFQISICLSYPHNLILDQEDYFIYWICSSGLMTMHRLIKFKHSL